MKKTVKTRVKFKKLCLGAMATLLLFPFTIKGQLYDANPLKNGNPWMVGGVPVLTPERLARVNAIPVMSLSAAAAQTTLPAEVDNSQTDFMPNIFSQGPIGSCAQCAGVSYTFAYEINCMRNLNDKVTENEYPELFSYNFVNGGADYGSSCEEGWAVLKDLGCPNRVVYPNKTDYIMWMSGYDKYYQAMQNRVESYYTIDVSTEAGLIALKGWLYDHNNGGVHGGLAVFGTVFDGRQESYAYLPAASSHANYIIFFPSNYPGNTGKHAMTIVGYDDNVKYDYNGDGQYTNNMDITGDGQVTMADWEIGAFKIANSHGTSWPSAQTIVCDPGYAYMSYRYCAVYLNQVDDPQYAIELQKVYVVTPKPVIPRNLQVKQPLHFLTAIQCF